MDSFKFISLSFFFFYASNILFQSNLKTLFEIFINKQNWASNEASKLQYPRHCFSFSSCVLCTEQGEAGERAQIAISVSCDEGTASLASPSGVEAGAWIFYRWNRYTWIDNEITGVIRGSKRGRVTKVYCRLIAGQLIYTRWSLATS